MTHNLKLYLTFSILWSLPFFATLNWALVDEEHRWPVIWGAALVYGLGFAVIGKYLGKRDDDTQVSYSLRYAYPAVSNLSSALVGGIWIVFFHPEELWQLGLYLVVIALLIGIGLRQYKRSIKGMSNRELFQ